MIDITKPLMFSKLSREHAIVLLYTNWHDKETMIKQLFIYLEMDGYNYAERASYQLLQDLAKYEQIVYNAHTVEAGLKCEGEIAPECVTKVYDIMFDYLDETIKRIVGYNFEIETWEDELGDIDGSVTAWNENEAWDEYNMLVADGYKVRLLKIDLLKENEDWCNACEVLAANF